VTRNRLISDHDHPIESHECARYGWQIRAIGSPKLLPRDDVSVRTFTDRREVGVATTNERDGTSVAEAEGQARLGGISLFRNNGLRVDWGWFATVVREYQSPRTRSK